MSRKLNPKNRGNHRRGHRGKSSSSDEAESQDAFVPKATEQKEVPSSDDEEAKEVTPETTSEPQPSDDEDDSSLGNHRRYGKKARKQAAAAASKAPKQSGKSKKAIKAATTEHLSDRGIRGLQNLGNTCFMNSVLQVLNQTIPMVDFFHFSRPSDNPNAVLAGQLSVALGVFISKLWTLSTEIYSPKALLKVIVDHAPQFRGNHQHDAQELLYNLLDQLRSEYESEAKDSINPVTQIFGGSLCSTVICHECRQVSRKVESFFDLSLAMSDDRSKHSTEDTSAYQKQAKSKTKHKGQSPEPRDKEESSEENSPDCPQQPLPDVQSEATMQADSSCETQTQSDLHDVFQVNLLDPARMAKYQEDHRKYGLTACLLDFFRPELLQGAEGYMCDKCSKIEVTSSTAPHDDPPQPLGSEGNGEKLDTETKGHGDGVCEQAQHSDVVRDLALQVESLCLANKNDEDNDTGTTQELAITNGELHDAASTEVAETPESPPTPTASPPPSPKRKPSKAKPAKGRSTPKPPKSKGSSTKKEPPRPPPKLTTASKQVSIHQLPQTLVVHLKRFCCNEKNKWKKNTVPISFPTTIDLSSFIAPTSPCRATHKSAAEVDAQYQLYGVVEHQGNMNGGHYVCFVKYFDKDTKCRDGWVHCSDTSISLASEQQALDAEPYLLFYERKFNGGLEDHPS